MLDLSTKRRCALNNLCCLQIAIIVLLSCTPGIASEKFFATDSNYLGLKVSSEFGRSDCFQESENAFLANSRASLKVVGRGSEFTEFETGNYPGLTYGWPDGLIIEAGLMRNGVVRMESGLAESMEIERWIDGFDQNADSIWRATGQEPQNSGLFVSGAWTFSFTVPNRPGDTIVFVVRLEKDGETISSKTGADLLQSKRFFVVASPCTHSDSSRVYSTFVISDAMGKRESRAMLLADSLIKVGWSEVAGLQFATVAATIIGDPEKALQYLDYNYMTNGRVDIFSLAETPERRESEYNRIRSTIVRQVEDKQNKE